MYSRLLGMSIYIYIYLYIYIYSTFFMMEEPDGSPKAWRIFGTFFGVEALGRRRAELRTPISIFVSCFLPKKTHTNNFPFRILGIRLLEWICSTWIKGIHEPFRIKSSFYFEDLNFSRFCLASHLCLTNFPFCIAEFWQSFLPSINGSWRPGGSTAPPPRPQNSEGFLNSTPLGRQP